MPEENSTKAQLVHEISRSIDLRKGNGRKEYLEGLQHGFILIENFAPSALKIPSIAELKEKFDDVCFDEGI